MNEFAVKEMIILSPQFTDGGIIPARYTFLGDNVHPPFSFKGIPLQTASLAMIVEKYVSRGEGFDHWIIWNILPTPAIAENSASGITGKNSAGLHEYTGPLPPFGSGLYVFYVYALTKMLKLDNNVSKQDLKEAMDNFIIAKGMLRAYHKIDLQP